ncbi:multidrug transporter [Salmonella enterica]|nr:multidrug transporter [Salmonella enterica]
MRLQVLLVTVSLVITTGRFFVLDTSDRREAMQVMLLVMLILHVLALLLPSVWLFYQWQWDGEFLMQWQGYVFGLALLVLPAAVIIFSS